MIVRLESLTYTLLKSFLDGLFSPTEAIVMPRISRPKRAVAALLAVAALAAFLSRGPAPETSAADHRDGPILVNTATQGTKDVNDIYLFRSPANPTTHTVFFFSFQPFPGNLTP